MTKPDDEPAAGDETTPERVRPRLQLYVSGSTPRSSRAIANIKAIGDTLMHGDYDLEVIDGYQQAERLRDQRIVVLPTLIKNLPLPVRHMVGDLSDAGQVLIEPGLDPK